MRLAGSLQGLARQDRGIASELRIRDDSQCLDACRMHAGKGWHVISRLVSMEHMGLEPQRQGDPFQLIDVVRLSVRGQYRDAPCGGYRLVQQRQALGIELGCQHHNTYYGAAWPSEALGAGQPPDY
jgi:hypothetical protein